MFAGIDIGSVVSKAVITDGEGNIAAFLSIPTTYDREACGRGVLALALKRAKKK